MEETWTFLRRRTSKEDELKTHLDETMKAFLKEQASQVTDLTTRMVDGLVRLEVLIKQKCDSQNGRISAMGARLDELVQKQAASVEELRAQDTRLNGRVNHCEKMIRTPKK